MTARQLFSIFKSKMAEFKNLSYLIFLSGFLASATALGQASNIPSYCAPIGSGLNAAGSDGSYSSGIYYGTAGVPGGPLLFTDFIGWSADPNNPMPISGFIVQADPGITIDYSQCPIGDTNEFSCNVYTSWNIAKPGTYHATLYALYSEIVFYQPTQLCAVIVGQFQIVVGSTVTLSVGPITVTPSTPAADGNPSVNPGTPTIVTAMVSATGVTATDTRSTQVTLSWPTQTGGPLTQTIALASLANGPVPVNFSVTFKPTDAGNQFLTVTADPTGALGGPYIASQLVHFGQYSLSVSVNGPVLPQSGGQFSIAPAVYPIAGCKASDPTSLVSQSIVIQCLDEGGNLASGCHYNTALLRGNFLGGHFHDPTGRPLSCTDDINCQGTSSVSRLGQKGSIPQTGILIPYVPSDIAGEVDLNITGTDPNGNPLQAPPIVFMVESQIEFEPLTAPGLTIETVSHPGEGDFGTAAMQNAVSSMMTVFSDFLSFVGLASPSGGIQSGGATLQYGGLFDAFWNGSASNTKIAKTPWLTPHCGHRDGQTIDLSTVGLSPDQLYALKFAARDAGFSFYGPESPDVPGVDHWHAYIGHQ